MLVSNINLFKITILCAVGVNKGNSSKKKSMIIKHALSCFCFVLLLISDHVPQRDEQSVMLLRSIHRNLLTWNRWNLLTTNKFMSHVSHYSLENHLISPFSLSFSLSLSLCLPLWPSLPPLFQPFILLAALCVFQPALFLMSDFFFDFFPPPVQKPCLKPDIVCQAPSDLLQSRGGGGPVLSIRPRHSRSPVRRWRLPRWNHLPSLLFLLFPSIFYSLSLSLILPTFHSGVSFLVARTCSAPSLHRWLNVIRQPYSPSNSTSATITLHQV